MIIRSRANWLIQYWGEEGSHLHYNIMKWLRKLLALALLASPLSALALFEQCKDVFPNQMIPISPMVGRDLCFDGFAIYYSPVDKKPIYTVERLNGRQLSEPHPRRANRFYEEARLPFRERALLSDYRGSGYDRGHNVPAGDMTNELGMAQSFSLANMMPQARQNNQGIWAKNVEEPTRQYAKRSAGDLYVYTGSTGSQGSIGASKVTVPSHLFKLVYDPQKNTAWAYWVDNTNEANMSPPISYQELKQKTGIDFGLPENIGAAHASKTPSKPLLGGWYPVFFDSYLPNKLAEIVAAIQAGRVASVQIQYDHNEMLAKTLAESIRNKTGLQPSLIQSSPPESSEVTYERNRVTAIIHSH